MSQNLYNISIFRSSGGNNNPKKLNQSKKQSFGTANNPQSEYAWQFRNSPDQKFAFYEFLDFYRFHSTDPNLDLSHYTIKLQPKKGTAPLSTMWMQIGDQSMEGTSSGKAWLFKLSTNTKDSQIKKYLRSPGQYKGFNSARTFTFFEYPTKKNNTNYFGKNNLVLSIGPNYEIEATKKIYASKLKPQSKLIVKKNGFTIIPGSLAQKLLTFDQQKPLNLYIDKTINSAKKLLTQSVIYSSDNGNSWNIFMLDYSQPLNVIGDGGTVDGSYQSNHPPSPNNNPFTKFHNALLDVQSSFSPSNSKKKSWSSTIQGVTFKNPATRYQGTVTANSGYQDIVTKDAYFVNKNASWKRRLLTAVETHSKCKDDSPCSQPGILQEKSFNNSRSHVFDNHIVGGWKGASDGIEVGTPSANSGRNFFHVSDDAIKMTNKNQQFYGNTIHQGAVGAPLSFAYGAGKGPSKNIDVNGLFIHRITQPNGIYTDKDPRESYAGLVMDWYAFNQSNQDPLTGVGGYGPAHFETIYIPSMKNTNGVEANSMSSYGYISTVREKDLSRPDFGSDSSGYYRAGGYTFENRKVDIDVTNKPKGNYLMWYQNPDTDGPNKGLYVMTIDAKTSIPGSPLLINPEAPKDQSVYVTPYGVTDQ